MASSPLILLSPPVPGAKYETLRLVSRLASVPAQALALEFGSGEKPKRQQLREVLPLVELQIGPKSFRRELESRAR